MMFYPILVVGLFLSLVIQYFIPPIPWVHDARLLLLPVIFFYCALAVPFWGMLIYAFITGFIWDAMTVQVVDSAVEISLGWSIIVYAVLGAIMNGFRPWFLRGRWEVHCLLSGICTALIVFIEYLMITFRRSGFEFPTVVWWRIGGAGILAAAMSPIVFFILNWIGEKVGFNPESEEKPAF